METTCKTVEPVTNIDSEGGLEQDFSSVGDVGIVEGTGPEQDSGLSGAGNPGNRFADWYAEHSAEWNQSRRERYERDAAYRKKVNEWNARARERRREAVLAERRSQAPLWPKVSGGRGWKVVQIEGVGAAFSLGALAALTARSPVTLRMWEKRGILPETPYRDAAGGRLYLLEQMHAIVETLVRKGVLKERGEEDGVKVTSRVPRVEFRNVRFVDGSVQKLRVYKIADVAAILESRSAAIKRREQGGMFPATTLRTPIMQQRRYTFGQLRAVADVWNELGGACHGRKQWVEFTQKVEKLWREQGIVGAVLQV